MSQTERENSKAETSSSLLRASPSAADITDVKTLLKGDRIVGRVIDRRELLELLEKKFAEDGAENRRAAVILEKQLRQETLNVVRAENKKLGSMQDAGLIPEWEPSDISLKIGDFSVFRKVKVGNSAYFLRVIRPQGNLINELKRWDGTIEVMSGLCLFTAFAFVRHADSTLTSITDPKRYIAEPVVGLDVSDRVSLYEAEGVYRLWSLIGNYVKGMRNKHKVCVNRVDLTTAYRLYAMNAYNAGNLTREQFLGWAEMVDRRASILGDAQQRVLDSASGERIAINDKNALSCIAKYIDDSVAHGEKVESEVAIEMLKKSPNQVIGLWSNMEPADSWRNVWKPIIYTSYVSTLLKLCNDGSVAVQIDNSEERRVNEEAQKAVAELKIDTGRQGRFAAVLTHTQLVIPDSEELNFYYLPYHITESVEQQLAERYKVENVGLSKIGSVGIGLRKE